MRRRSRAAVVRSARRADSSRVVSRLRVVHDRDHQAVVGLRGEAEVDPLGNDDLVLLDARVQLGVAAQAEDGEPGQQGEQADRSRRVGGVQRPPRLDQAGGVDVDPDGRLRDLPAGAGQLVGGRPPRAAQRDAPLARAGPFVRCGLGEPLLARGALGDGPSDILAAYQAVWTRAGQGGQVQVGVPGFLADERRDHCDPAWALRCRRRGAWPAVAGLVAARADGPVAGAAEVDGAGPVVGNAVVGRPRAKAC